MTNETIELEVEGMSCQGCVRSVRAILSKSLQIEREAVEVDLEAGAARFPFAGEAGAIDEAIAHLGKQGFEARVRA